MSLLKFATMLQPIMHTLATQRIVLASGSPRRREILQNIGLKFEVIPSKAEENLDKSSFQHPYEYAMATAHKKTMEVIDRLTNDPVPPHLIIGSDTVVTMDGEIFEKPADRNDAIRMISRFSGRSHTVYTGVVLATWSKETYDVRKFHVGTEVLFAPLTPEIIEGYVATGEYTDKAGGYGIQALAGTLVEGVRGDYFNVMGFPLHRVCKEILSIYTENGLSDGAQSAS